MSNPDAAFHQNSNTDSAHGEHTNTKDPSQSRKRRFEHTEEEIPFPRVKVPILFKDAPHVETTELRLPMPDQRMVDAVMFSPVHTEQSYAEEVSRQDSSQACSAQHHVFRTRQSCFEHIEPLGHGSYGMVDKIKYSGTALTNGKHYARKIVRCRDTKQLDATRKELDIIKRLCHGHIVTTMMTYEEIQGRHHNFGIIMEPVADSNLQEYLIWAAEQKNFPPDHVKRTVLSWFGCLASALAYLHAKRIRHKDIKPGNILIRNEQIFYTDFGLSRSFDEDAGSKSVGDPGHRTIKYSAPEVEAGQERGRKSDVFSLGCVYLELLTLLAGRSSKDFQKFLRDDAKKAYHQIPQKITSWMFQLQPYLSSVPQQRSMFCTLSMLEHNPQVRASSFEVASRLAICGKKMGSRNEKELCPCRDIFGPIGDCKLTM